MEYLQIDAPILERQVNEIGALVSEAGNIFRTGQQVGLSAAYSEVSGLDQMGASHGLVVQGGAGSAVQTLQKYAEQVAWLRDGLKATERSLVSQEGLAERALQIADEGGAVGAESTLFPARPDQVFEDFSFPTPSVSIPASLAELSAAFAATDASAVAASVEAWSGMSKNAAQLAENIRTTAWDIAEINKADSINAAVDRALEVADAADVFANNAGLMSTSVEYMGQVAQVSGAHVAMAEMAIAMIPDPVERKAAEQEFLTSFMGSTFPAAVESTMPVIRNLMKMEQVAAGGEELQAQMGLVDGNGKPGPIARIQAGSQQLEQLVAQPQNMGPGSFEAIAQNMQQLDAIDPSMGGFGLPSLGDFGTEVSSAFGGISPVGGMVADVPTGAHAAVTPYQFSPVGGGLGAAGTPGGKMAPVGGVGKLAGGGGALGPTDLARGSQQFGAMSPLAGGAPAFGAAGRAGSVGAGMASGRPGMMTAPGFSTALPAQASVSGSGSAMGRGMVPMGGAPLAGAQQDDRRGKVKTVTSAVEEESNLHALLGDLPPVVPGPIGAWARG